MSPLAKISSAQSSFVKRLSAERKLRKMTYRVLAERTEINLMTLHDTLNLTNPKPSFVVLAAIADAFGWHFELKGGV